MKQRYLTFVLFFLLIPGLIQAQLFRPYKCGPVLKKDGIETFERLNKYLEIKPGSVFAEVGASSGYYNGAMAVYLDSVTFYLQVVDQECLNEDNLQQVLRYYSKLRKAPVNETNSFHIVIGTETRTNLPKESIDIIYSNATYHALNQPDSIIADLYRSLKHDGVLAIRDEFIDGEEVKYCADKDCRNPLALLRDFQTVMSRNGFDLFDQTDQFGYPVYKYRKRPQ